MPELNLQPIGVDSHFLKSCLNEFVRFQHLSDWYLRDVRYQLFDDAELYVFHFCWKENTGEGPSLEQRTAALALTAGGPKLPGFRIDYCPSWLPVPTRKPSAALTPEQTFVPEAPPVDRALVDPIQPLVTDLEFRFEAFTGETASLVELHRYEILGRKGERQRLGTLLWVLKVLFGRVVHHADPDEIEPLAAFTLALHRLRLASAGR